MALKHNFKHEVKECDEPSARMLSKATVCGPRHTGITLQGRSIDISFKREIEKGAAAYF